MGYILEVPLQCGQETNIVFCLHVIFVQVRSHILKVVVSVTEDF